MNNSQLQPATDMNAKANRYENQLNTNVHLVPTDQHFAVSYSDISSAGSAFDYDGSMVAFDSMFDYDSTAANYDNRATIAYNMATTAAYDLAASVAYNSGTIVTDVSTTVAHNSVTALSDTATSLAHEVAYKAETTAADLTSANDSCDIKTEVGSIGGSEVVTEAGLGTTALKETLDTGGAGDTAANVAVDHINGTEPAGNSDDPVIDISINNVVCAFNTRCYLNLKALALRGMNVEYKRATGMVSMKLRKPSVTASIWASGKVTCTGSRSEEEARVAARKVARCIQRLGFNVKQCYEFRVVNVLGTCSLAFRIRINEFSRKYSDRISYEPELHPGATYKLTTPKATLKIFSTGSITVTAPRISNIQRAIEHVYPMVVGFRLEKIKGDTSEESIQQSNLSLPCGSGQKLFQSDKVSRKRKREHGQSDSDSEAWSNASGNESDNECI